jgi:integrase
VYLSYDLVRQIAEQCPTWFQRIIWTSYYSGMRRGEIVALTRKSVDLGKRIMFLRPGETKEGKAKRVPIHRHLSPILQSAMAVPYIGSDHVFLMQDDDGIREPGRSSIVNPWPRACKKLGLNPAPRFHDLRHTWRTNARRSGIDAQIAESILGHWMKVKSVNDRYGRISDEELIQAIDMMTFDHGETEIVLNTQPRKNTVASPEKGSKKVTRTPKKQQRPQVTRA